MTRTYAVYLCIAVLLCVFSSCTRKTPVVGSVLFSENPPLVIRNMITGTPIKRVVPEPHNINLGERSHIVYYCKHQRPTILRDAIKTMIGLEGSISISNELNAIILSDLTERANELLKVLQVLDVWRPQLLVEARLVEVNLDSNLEIEMNQMFSQEAGSTKGFVQTSEISLGTPGNAPLVDQGLQANIRPWTNSSGLAKLDIFFRGLIENGQAKVLSSPNVVVGSGEQTSIITGEEVPIFSSTFSGGNIQVSTTFKQVGVKLRVKVLQIAGNTVEIEVNPEVSSVIGVSTGPQGSTSPILAVRQMRATLRLNDGEVLSIGGLVREEERENIRKTPILGDIPLLGHLFRSKRKSTARTQLLFFLRVHIMGDGKAGTARIHIPGSSMKDINHELLQAPADTPSEQEENEPLENTESGKNSAE